jgi:hypothetical protein
MAMNGELASAIDAHTTDLGNTAVSDQPSARVALAHVLVSVSELNRRLEQSPETDVPAETLRATGILEKLQHWIEKLTERLRMICSELKATFSITVGTPMTVSVTVDFQPGW